MKRSMVGVFPGNKEGARRKIKGDEWEGGKQKMGRWRE